MTHAASPKPSTEKLTPELDSRTLISNILQTIGEVLLGKEQQVKLSLTCLLAQGHLLIEDLPGMGKTTLAQCLARVLGLSFERVQFTNDLLPADILGVSIFEAKTSEFRFHAGPVFTQVLLADEINRTTPKTQSALLEAMEERQVSVEGETRPLPSPFFVIATQNPLDQAGTYPLPESQLDRFLMRISLGYPSKASERQLLEGVDPRSKLTALQAQVSPEQLKMLQASIENVKASEAVLDYLQRLVECSRVDDVFTIGLSPRGAMALLRASKAWAFLNGREYLLPDDVQAVLPSVVGHRVNGSQVHSQNHAGSLTEYLLKNVDVIGH